MNSSRYLDFRASLWRGYGKIEQLHSPNVVSARYGTLNYSTRTVVLQDSLRHLLPRYMLLVLANRHGFTSYRKRGHRDR